MLKKYRAILTSTWMRTKALLHHSPLAMQLGRVCKLGLDGGKAGLSSVRHTARLAEDPSNQLRSWTRAEPLHRSGSLQTRPSSRPPHENAQVARLRCRPHSNEPQRICSMSAVHF